MAFPEFFARVPAVTLRDPLAELLGAAEGGLIEYRFADAVKLTGHSCPTVAGAWLMTVRALRALYGDEIPERGNVAVALRESLDSGVAGVIGSVAGLLTGAAGAGGFKGLGGRHSRRNLLQFGVAGNGSVHEQLLTLRDDCLLYPGHDYRGVTCTSVAEERRWNPRFGGRSSLDDFVGYMTHLGLPHPRQMDRAVPANLRCGRPDGDLQAPPDPAWAPLVWTFAGLWEIEPVALQELAAQVQVVDVREPAEYHGPLGHIAGARLMPMASLSAHQAALDPKRPVVTVCRSGTRSAQAALQLNKAGFADVANLAGGMLRWQAERLPVEGAEVER